MLFFFRKWNAKKKSDKPQLIHTSATRMFTSKKRWNLQLHFSTQQKYFVCFIYENKKKLTHLEKKGKMKINCILHVESTFCKRQKWKYTLGTTEAGSTTYYNLKIRCLYHIRWRFLPYFKGQLGLQRDAAICSKPEKKKTNCVPCVDQ